MNKRKHNKTIQNKTKQNKTKQNKTKPLAKQSKPLAKYKNKAVKIKQNKTTPLFCKKTPILKEQKNYFRKITQFCFKQNPLRKKQKEKHYLKLNTKKKPLHNNILVFEN